jgi:Mn2+/Fe2+ NRAMP family transporter
MMTPLGFGAVSTLVGLAFTAFIAVFYFRWFRRIPTLATFTPDERRILTYQLAAISGWTIAGLSVYFLSVWSSAAFEALTAAPANLIVAAINLALFGFVAATSMVRRVSILTAVRLGGQPSKGRRAMAYGFALLCLLAFATWKVLSLGS